REGAQCTRAPRAPRALRARPVRRAARANLEVGLAGAPGLHRRDSSSLLLLESAPYTGVLGRSVSPPAPRFQNSIREGLPPSIRLFSISAPKPFALRLRCQFSTGCG